MKFEIGCRIAVWMAMCAAVTGCASFPGWTGSGSRPPLAPAVAALPRAAVQTLHVARGDRSLVLQCALDVAPGGWKTACVTATGQRLFTLEVDAAGQARLEGDPAQVGSLDGARMAADIQLALWPIEALQQAQRGSRWSTHDVSSRTRRLLHEQHLVAEVHYCGDDPWSGISWIANYRERYSLEIRTRRPDDADPTD